LLDPILCCEYFFFSGVVLNIIMDESVILCHHIE